MTDIAFHWLFNQRALGLRPLNTAQPTFSTIHASELADPTEFTAPGAIILTLGLAFEQHPDGFERYCAALASANVAGIGFGTGLTFAAVPPQLLAAATRHHLTLFEVPRATAFIAIMGAVTAEQTRLDNNAQFALHRQQERLNQAAHGGIEALTAQASQELKAAVALASNSGAAVARRDFRGIDATPAAVEAAAQTGRSAGARATTTRDGQRLATITSVFPAPGQRRFALAVSRAEKFDSYARALIRHLVGLAGLLLQHPDAAAQTLLGALTLSTQLTSPQDPLQHTALKAAWNTVASRGEVTALAVAADSPARLSRCLIQLSQAATRTGIPYFALPLAQDSAALIALPPTATISPTQLFGRLAPHLRISILPATAYAELTQPLLNALLTHARSLSQGAAESYDASAPSWLASPHVHAALSTRRAATIDILRAHDATHGTELLRTLRTYLVAGANLATAAAELGLHRHTIRARIDKIQTLCHADLTNPITRAELLLLSIEPDAAG
ncbi:PucR family transcriptional regulator [Corynebacterium lizhenjunii]|uniref:PucR family transcriptional regulator n=1 Tax=Corynebacterium lizhenjunii TaxID=2709394 RepID=UPI0013EA9A59|nr:PucR family transcriptional regulator [Corynebacterium lizhenjunii]